MSLFSRLFGGQDASPTFEPIAYKGCTIVPQPMAEGPRYRVAARIEKGTGPEKRVHRMIRADVLEDEQAAVQVATAKAKQMIDEQGDRLFG